jgi:hypothetical protein
MMKGGGTMSFAEDQASKEALLNAEEDAASRTFAHEPGEGEAWWWVGMLAIIKATKEQTGGLYALVEVLAPDGYGACCTSITERTRASGSSKAN